MSSIRVTLYGKCLHTWEMVTRLCIRIFFVCYLVQSTRFQTWKLYGLGSKRCNHNVNFCVHVRCHCCLLHACQFVTVVVYSLVVKNIVHIQ